MDIPKDTVMGTLEQISRGASYLVTATRQRINEAVDALDSGNFHDASHRLGEAQGRLQALVQAQVGIGEYADGKHIVRAREIEPGVNVVGWGVVTDVRVVHEGAPGQTDSLLILAFEDDEPEKQVWASTELLAVSE